MASTTIEHVDKPSGELRWTRQQRRTNGIYYTPQHIVHYMVRQTLDPLLMREKLAPEQPICVLDPACGEGAFLIEVYRYLLDRYLQYYINKGAKRFLRGKNAPVHQDRGGSWQLTLHQRKRILLTHLFGVELDHQAVEVTKELLACEALSSGKAAHSPAEQAPLMQRLASRIRCGNALVGSDYCAPTSGNGLESIRPFDWQAAFREVLDRGGFDAIVGNPPYVNIRRLSQHQKSSDGNSALKQYLTEHYQAARRGFDLYVLFIEKAQGLLKQGGMGGMIVPNKIATLEYAESCRSLLLNQTTLHRIDDVSDMPIFRDARVYPYILIWENKKCSPQHQVAVLHVASDDDLQNGTTSRLIFQHSLSAQQGFCIHGNLHVESRVATQSLEVRAKLQSGSTGFTAEKMARSLQEQTQEDSRPCFEFIVSGNIDRYAIRLGNVRFMKRRFARPVLPQDSACLSPQKQALYRRQKLVVSGLSQRLEIALDQQGLALGVQVFAISQPLDDMGYLLGLLNSQLMSYLFRLRFSAKRLAGGYLAINKGQLAKLPIRVIDFESAGDKQRHDEIVQQAGRLQQYYRQLATLSDCQQRTSLHEKIALSQQSIDRLVYQLYGLTTQEIAVVEAQFLKDE